ncbi:MAG TPA: peptidoglycan-associated lipoprotein Pal [Syntrophales bacterium]|mgnify:CR=1 FL=1|nr:peptidoglycan-associated lipoprotein Pal [Syntrophales bacterium]
MKRNLIVVGMMVFICSFSLIFIGGCAKEQAVRGDVQLAQTQPSAQETAQAEAQAKAQAEAQAQAEKEAALKEQALKEKALEEKALLEKLQAEADSFENIYFSFDKYDLSPEARNVLENLADWLLEHTDFEVTIEGHCDDRGTIAYNLALGERRAEAAKAYLVNLGVAGTRITTISYGEELPVDPGQNEEAWAKNRRDHFIVFPKK